MIFYALLIPGIGVIAFALFQFEDQKEMKRKPNQTTQNRKIPFPLFFKTLLSKA